LKFFRIIAVIVALYIGGFVLFTALLPSAPGGPLKADAIVALTGGDERLDKATALLEQGAGKRLLISGANKTATREEIKKLSGGGRRFDCCADIGYDAEDTYGNAEETASWVAAHGFKSLIVVTAAYHMPRSLRVFSSMMPHVTLIADPVEIESFGEWWTHPRKLELLHFEYLKYLTSFVMTLFDQDGNKGKSHPST
jgi:uncharacterized SAM-binding protein YcdF (DUF218 family)